MSDFGMVSTTLKNRVIFPLASIAISLVVLVVLLEIVLRFLPVCDAQRRQPVNERHPILRFEPNRTIQWSSRWNFAMANKIHINNDGFVSPVDYDPNGAGPLIAVIGDSYIEAAMVPYTETGQGRLAGALEGEARVYCFGISGSPLSQYLAVAEYARDTYHPQAMVIVIVGNDFDESLVEYRPEPGYHYFSERPDGTLALLRIDYTPGRLKQLASHSALARYLLINLKLLALPSRWRSRAHEDAPATFVGNTPSDAGVVRVERSELVIDTFLDELPARSGLDASRILLVVDGIRPQLYDPGMLAGVRGSYFDIMRRYLLEKAPPKGYEIVDMQPIFVESYSRDGERFEYLHNLHWNPHGHELFFEAMMQSDVVKRVYGDEE